MMMMMMIVVVVVMKILILIMITLMITITMIISLKDTISDVVQPPLCVANCLQRVRSSGQGAIVYKSRATHRTLIAYNMPCATWYEGIAQLLNLLVIAFKGAIPDYFTISSLRHEPSLTLTLKWPGSSRVQITCNTSTAYHVQHLVLRAMWYKRTAQLLSLTEFKSHLTINR